MTKTITGKTIHARDRLRRLGCQWDPKLRVWICPDNKAAQAQALVDDMAKNPDNYVKRFRFGGAARRMAEKRRTEAEPSKN